MFFLFFDLVLVPENVTPKGQMKTDVGQLIIWIGKQLYQWKARKCFGPS